MVSHWETPISQAQNPQKKRNIKSNSDELPKSENPNVEARRFKGICEYYLAPERQQWRDLITKNHGINDFNAAFNEFYELMVERNLLPQIRSNQDFASKFRFLYCIPLREHGINVPKGPLKERKKALRDEIQDILSTTRDSYGQPLFTADMCNNFFAYWSELSSDGILMRFESQRFWETKKRMMTWKRKTSD